MYQKTILRNRIKIVSHEMKGRDSAAVGIWAKIGGRYENRRNKGAAHFLEHILFKGTKKYGCQEIKERIEGVGGALNACTSQEFTCYYAKVPARHLNKTFDILADMVLYPLISKKDVDKERTVILEEIKMYHDLPQYLVGELLDALVWPNHPLGENLAGTMASVGGLTHTDLRTFHRRYYSAGNIVISVAGHLDHRVLVRLVRSKFSGLKPIAPTSFIKAENCQTTPAVKFLRKDIEQMHLALGIRSLENNHPDSYALNLLNIILGANMSSRLFNEVREKRGLAYAIASNIKYFQDTGLFSVRAGVDNQKIVQALEVILKELDKIKKTGVSKNEFMRAKDYYLGQILLDLEDTLDHMFWIGESTLTLDKMRTLRGVLEKVNRVKIGDIKRVAAEIFQENKFNLSVVGPLRDDQENDILSILDIRGGK